MKGNVMKKTITPLLSLAVLAVVAAVIAVPGFLYSQRPPAAIDASPFIQTILIAHNAWITFPNSIQIRGTLIRGNSKQPLTITATQQEEVIAEIGISKQVVTSSRQFSEDGEKTAFADTLNAFSQLDITSIFLMAQLSQRPEQAGPPEVITANGTRVTKVHLWSNRTQTHFRQIKVSDELDVFVDASGMLFGIERTFYPQDSRLRYTMGYRFSDYRNAGEVLLPYRIETVFKGNIEETILVNEYQVNVPVAKSQFQPRIQSRSGQ